MSECCKSSIDLFESGSRNFFYNCEGLALHRCGPSLTLIVCTFHFTHKPAFRFVQVFEIAENDGQLVRTTAEYQVSGKQKFKPLLLIQNLSSNLIAVLFLCSAPVG